jgi:VanZ family protein
MLLPLRYPRIWLVAGWMLIALAVLASLSPTQNLPDIGTNDKLGHLTAYALMTLWFSGIYPRSRYALIGLGMFVLGLLIEGAQGAMGWGRQADMYDLVANTSGIVAGLIGAWLGLGGWAQRVETLLARSTI